MKLYLRCLVVASFLLSFFFSQNALANNPDYLQRQADYRSNSVANFSRHAITIQPYLNLSVDSATLYQMLIGLSTKGTVDFDIVQLVRILYLSNGAYDTVILPYLEPIPFWLTKSDTLRGYWSENHMIQWMSSDWLLKEKYGKVVDANLDNRLRHYLRLKVNYGFYEFFSSTYAPYALSGLINLADFAQDAEIKQLATQASQRLLKDLLMLTNDKGVFYPVAGRNYFGKYKIPYDQNHNSLIYLLTGFGEVPTQASHSGGFLATSSLPVDSVIASWKAESSFTYHIGHTLDSGFVLNAGQSSLDKVMFQWSSGAYFHPAVAGETAQLLADSNLWNHVDFNPFRSFANFSVSSIVSLANILTVASKSSVICGQDVEIFKHNSVTLCSIKDFWKGKMGYQQYPCVANVGTTAVYTGSGKTYPDWDDRNSDNANDNLPYVGQNRNLALLMYRPEFKLPLLPSSDPEVGLYFNVADFDEVRSDSLWLLGRQADRYVAVRRHCLDSINTVPACYMNQGQAWVIMVGDSIMYNSFNNFQSLVQQSQFTEQWYLDETVEPNQWVYYAKITVDTLSVEYAWGVDSIDASGFDKVKRSDNLKLYPNPSTDVVNIDLSAYQNQQVTIQVNNTVGQTIFNEKITNPGLNKVINTNDWSEGMYIVNIFTPEVSNIGRFTKVK